MKRFGITIFPILIVALHLSGSPVIAQVVRDSVEDLDRIDVEEHLGGQIPLDLKFTNDRGNEVTLGDYFKGERPVILVLAYYTCPMLCNLVLNGVSAGVHDLGWTPGEKYQIVTVSFDPRDSVAVAAAKKKNYLANADLNNVVSGWDFLVGDESQSKALAEAVGFKYYWDESKQMYAHPAVIFLASGKGKITRYLYGLDYKGQDLKLALLEASKGKIGNTIDRIVLYCYHYDPDAGGYVAFAGNIMRLGGIVTFLLLAVFIVILWRRERRRSAARIAEHPHGNRS